MKTIKAALAVFLLAVGAESLATPSKTTGRLSNVDLGAPAPSFDGAVSTSFVEIVPLDQDDDEQDSSRRLLMTTMVGMGLLTATTNGIEPADAAMMIDSESKTRRTTTRELSSSASSSTTTTSDAAAAAAGAATSAAAVDWKSIVQKASKRALGGGKAGASAAVVQVCSLMWLRTSMNYQYRYGGNLGSSLKTLWEEGGIPRLYQGLPFAIVQGPMTRFGDTAANVGVLALLESSPATQDLPLPLKTACGSVAAGVWRIFLMPVDTSKTAMQVEGSQGLKDLWNDVLVVRKNPGPLYRGAFASAAATAVGHFPWFLTYNFLNEQIPEVSSTDDLLLSLARAALLGLCASCVSDVCSNSLRVIKTTKQTAGLAVKDEEGNARDLSYAEIVSLIIEKDGVLGLLGRGLQTRLLTNAIQGSIFSVLWKYFQMQN